MDSEKIIQDLNRRFAAPLPEFYKRRIVVWIDEDQEFVDKLDEITLGGAKVVALTGTNNFYVKKLLAVDDPASNYLLYRPFAYESDEDNWLLDVELYGEEFRTYELTITLEAGKHVIAVTTSEDFNRDANAGDVVKSVNADYVEVIFVKEVEIATEAEVVATA